MVRTRYFSSHLTGEDIEVHSDSDFLLLYSYLNGGADPIWELSNAFVGWHEDSRIDTDLSTSICQISRVQAKKMGSRVAREKWTTEVKARNS